MADMKYKKGEKVVINPRLLMVKRHGEGIDGLIKMGEDYFTPSMERCLKGTDRVVTITHFTDVGYGADFGEGEICSITDDMVLGHAFEYGQEIEVSDDGEKWKKTMFVSYSPGADHQFRSISFAHYQSLFEQGRPFCANTWEHARPIQEEAEKKPEEINANLATALAEILYAYAKTTAVLTASQEKAEQALKDAGVELT